jgi:hypothetical protein
MLWSEEPEEMAPVHTAQNPYCGDLSCRCHTDVDYHDQVTSPLSGETDAFMYTLALLNLGSMA